MEKIFQVVNCSKNKNVNYVVLMLLEETTN